jgi:hypothetical protein
VAADARRFPWIVGAVTAGGLAIPVLVAPGAGVVWLLFVGSSVHVASTFTLFAFADVRRHACAHPRRYVAAPLALVGAAAVTAALLPTAALQAPLLGFFGWQLWHYQQQNLGLAALATRATQRPPLTTIERRCIRVSAAAGILALAAHPQVTQLVTLRPPAVVSTAASATAWLLLAGAAAMQRRPIPLLAVAFPLPLLLTTSPYAALGGMTLAHGLQYLLLVGMVVTGPARGEGAKPRLAEGSLLLAGVVTIAGALAATSHLHHGAAATKAVFGAYLGIVMTHFVLDAGLWRLRDPFPRAWLGGRLPALLADTSVSDIESVPWPRPTPPTRSSSPAWPKARSTAMR